MMSSPQPQHLRAIKHQKRQIKTSPLVSVASSDEPHTLQTTKAIIRRYILAIDTFNSLVPVPVTGHIHDERYRWAIKADFI